MRYTGSNLCGYPLGMMKGNCVHMSKSVKPGFSDIILHLTGLAFVCLSITESIHSCHSRISIKKNCLLIFLVEVTQFSTMAHEKPCLQVLEEVKVESSDYSYINDEDDTLQ